MFCVCGLSSLIPGIRDKATGTFCRAPPICERWVVVFNVLHKSDEARGSMFLRAEGFQALVVCTHDLQAFDEWSRGYYLQNRIRHFNVEITSMEDWS